MNDWELIRRFAETRDETAFERIVERHGPSVLASWIFRRRRAFWMWLFTCGSGYSVMSAIS